MVSVAHLAERVRLFSSTEDEFIAQVFLFFLGKLIQMSGESLERHCLLKKDLSVAWGARLGAPVDTVL